MTDRWKPSRLLAGFLSFLAFVGSFVTLVLMLIIGAALPGYAQADLDAGRFVQDSEVLVGSISGAVGLVFAILVYRVARRSISREFTFHVCFIIGFLLLCYGLWAVLTLVPILDSGLLSDWSTHILQAVFSGPVICLFVVPVALLFLAFATLHDNDRNS